MFSSEIIFRDGHYKSSYPDSEYKFVWKSGYMNATYRTSWSPRVVGTGTFMSLHPLNYDYNALYENLSIFINLLN